MFLALKDGVLMRVLEDHEDVEGLEEVGELLCAECNRWFPNPARDAHERELTGELVMVTGLKGKGTIKTVATGLTMPFHYDTYEDEVADRLQGEDMVTDLKEFARRGDAQLALRVKEEGNPNTWTYRLDHKRLWKALGV